MEYEIERKFLVEYPDVKKLDVRGRKGIIQTYLVNGEHDSQRRVRKIDEDGAVSYTYTEKIFITPVTREESEKTITSEEYEILLKQARTDFKPVEKVRYVFDYHGQRFELDTYPFSDKLAIMELEMKTADQVIDFPDNVKVIKEVSADKRYSNSALALAGRFPMERNEESI